MSDLASLEKRALEELRGCADEAALRAWNNKYFGKQGEVAQALKQIGHVPPDERRAFGLEANRVKEVLLGAHEAAQNQQKALALARDLKADALDVT